MVPGLTTPDNLKTANQAMDMFKEVLAQNPNDVNSMKEIAGIYFSIKDLDEAEDMAEEGSRLSIPRILRQPIPSA